MPIESVRFAKMLIIFFLPSFPLESFFPKAKNDQLNLGEEEEEFKRKVSFSPFSHGSSSICLPIDATNGQFHLQAKRICLRELVSDATLAYELQVASCNFPLATCNFHSRLVAQVAPPKHRWPSGTQIDRSIRQILPN